MTRFWLNTFIVFSISVGSIAKAACYVPEAPTGGCSYELVLDANGEAIQDDVCDPQGVPTGEKENRLVCKQIKSNDVEVDPTHKAWLDRMPKCKTVNSRGRRNRSCERQFLAWQNSQPDAASSVGGSNGETTGSVGSGQIKDASNSIAEVEYTGTTGGSGGDTTNVDSESSGPVVVVPTYQIGPTGQVDYQPPSIYRRTFSY